MTNATQDRVGQWVEEAARAMGGDPSSRLDAKRELASAIYDKVDERTRAGEGEEAAVEIVLREMGDARSMGHAFLPQAPLVAPERTRSFLLATAALFAVHIVLVIGSTIASVPLALPPLHIRPLEDSGFFGFTTRALEVLLFDAGLMLALFMIRARIGRMFRLPRVAERTGRGPRHHIQTAAFLGLVLVVVNFLRDNLVALYLPAGEATLQVPILGSGFTDNIVWFNAWVLLALVRELAFAARGRTATTRWMEFGTRVLGIFCLLRMVATRKIVDLSAAGDALGTSADTVGSLLNSTMALIALAAAALLAMALVQRD